MAFRQFNLFLRFILEMTTLFMAGWWGWMMHFGWNRYVLVIGLPVLMAVIWGVFAVPGDPSRSGKTVVVTPGWIRLVIEFVFFTFGVWIFSDFGYRTISIVFAVVVFLHYAFSYDRLKWMLKQ
jgi:hypothetical protein